MWSPRRRLSPSVLAVWLLPALAVPLTLRWTSGIGFVETDSFPFLAASRVETLCDLLAIFRRDMFGFHGEAVFYRPVVNLTLALDHALWGLRPVGYQLTNAVLFALCGGVLALLTRRLVGSRGRAALWVVPLVFLIHPSHVEVVAGAPRRQETLCALFLMLALLCQLSWPARSRVRGLAVTVMMCLAMASKEAAVIGPVLGFAVALGSTGDRSVAGRAWQAVRATFPYVLGVAVMVGVRFMVTGRLGGHLPLEAMSGAWERVPFFGLWMSRKLLTPQRMHPEYGFPAGMVCAALVAAVALATARRGALAARARDEPDGPHPGRLALLGAAWLAAVVALHASTGLVQPWHVLLPVIGWSMLWGALAETAVAAVPTRGLRPRVAASVGLLALAGIVGWSARDSPWFVDYPEYRRLMAMTDRFLSALERRIETAAGGDTVPAGPLPFWRIPPSPDAATVFGATALNTVSLEAWFEVMFPDRRIRLVRPAEVLSAAPPAADEIVVVLGRGAWRGSAAPGGGKPGVP
jgi:hypothetical protein